MGLINLNHPAHFIGIGHFNLSVGNFIIVATMFALFFLALFLPFPHGKDSGGHRSGMGKQSSGEKHQDHTLGGHQ